MSNDTKHNGWSSYETWAVAQHIDNEEGSYNYWRDATRELWEQATATTYSTKTEEATIALADQLKDELAENNPLTDCSLYSDLLNAALSSDVNYAEIAKNWLEEFAEVTS